MKPILEQIADIKAIKHDIREAIQAQGGRLGGEAPFSDYPDAILALSGPGPDACRVIFIDWDGTILKDVKVNPGDAVVPPETPAHPHLTFKRWNRSDATLASVQNDMCVGAVYDVEGNHDWAYVEAAAGETVQFYVYGTSGYNRGGVIDWGDGTQTALPHDGVNHYPSAVTHVYAEAFAGWIAIIPDEGRALHLLTQTADPFWYTSSSSRQNALSDNVKRLLFGYWEASAGLFFKNAKVEAVCIADGSKLGTGYDSSATFTVETTDYMKGIVLHGDNHFFSSSVRGEILVSTAAEEFIATTNADFAAMHSAYAAVPILEIPEGVTSFARNGSPWQGVKSFVLPASFNPANVLNGGSSTNAYLIEKFVAKGPVSLASTWFFRQLLIRGAFNPTTDSGPYFYGTFMMPADVRRFLESLPASEASRTIRFYYVPHAYRESLAAIATEKGYTLAFS